MKFCFQIQFSPDDDESARARIGAGIARIVQESDQVVHSFGEQGDPPVTITVQSIEPVLFWDAITPRLKAVPVNLIVVCEGEHGWDDYLLLHHFDEQQELDYLR